MSWGWCVSLSRLRMKGKGGLLEEGRGAGGGGGHFDAGSKARPGWRVWLQTKRDHYDPTSTVRDRT